jgi:stearoyl-CoA desaturase (delta-9 desaturase)
MLEEPRSRAAMIGLWVFVVGPFVVLAAALVFLPGRSLSTLDIVMAVVGYVVTGFGVTVGFHRYFTHNSFKAGRAMRVVLAVAGSLAAEGAVTQWVADHRRHHAFADREGDPHSPWRYGATVPALLRGMFHAQVGWLFARDVTNRERFAPDRLADRDIRRVDGLFPMFVALSLLVPAGIGWLVSGTFHGALTGFLWAGVVRMAILSFGESWHNSHHADPTGARHGVLKGQLDPSAALIRGLERLRLVRDVRWPRPDRLQSRVR